MMTFMTSVEDVEGCDTSISSFFCEDHVPKELKRISIKRMPLFLGLNKNIYIYQAS